MVIVTQQLAILLPTTGDTSPVLGQVTAIDGNTITLALGTENEKPTQSDTNSSTDDTTTPDAKQHN